MTDSIDETLKITSPMSALLNTSAPKTCIICGAKAIRAHAISKSNVLDKLAKDGKVISVYYDITTPFEASFGLVGTGKVSTFSAFCSRHDQQLFKSLDEGAFYIEDKDQEIKMAFRAFARACWFNAMESIAHQRKIDAVAMRDVNFIKKYIGVERVYQSHVSGWIKSRDVAVGEYRDLAEILAVLKEGIMHASSNSILATRTILLPDSYPIAASGAGILHCDCINANAYLPKAFTYNLFSDENSTYAVLSIPREHESCLDNFLDTVFALKDTNYRILLTHILTSTCTEALAISPGYWKQLDNEVKEEFMNLWKDGASWTKRDSSQKPVPTLSIFDETLL